MITKNFRVNALANQYAAALYDAVRRQSGGDFFTIDAAGRAVQVNIVGGTQGIRQLVDSYLLEALQQEYRQWEDVAAATLSACMEGSILTTQGRQVWKSMIGDMGATVAQGGQINA
ncbi:hypothetical protein [Pectobacterium versatile]|uniref:hypothetical protein n=1 Tax=Pectobacterium versatile TaxID=2488639 RepID=UPI0015DED6AC|nr:MULTISPECIES: hypothetical protein [Pectobacterium]MBA0171226.1 hypothetical protein [Pectobacterium versatile]MCA6917015.1 hypothetical protein [Pectobacterium versatile]MCL6374443.1 hypothetical protein [Pectobacterium atrosepticum]